MDAEDTRRRPDGADDRPTERLASPGGHEGSSEHLRDDATGRDRPPGRAGGGPAGAPALSADRRAAEGREMIARQRAAFGGMRVGAAFFGFLTAAGVAVLLTAIVVATGAAVGIGVEDVTDGEVATIGLWGTVVVGVLVLLAYYAGGYVAGRMARFDGARQGLAVWLWALLIAVVVAVVTAVAGQEYNVFAQVNLFPRIPVEEGDLTTAGVVAAVVAVLVALLGAVLGGIVGVRFHRKVDRAGLAL